MNHPVYRRYLRTGQHGRPQIDPAKVREEARLDDKYLVRASDDTVVPEDVALGYKQLIEVEDAFGTLKHTLDLRPVYHRLEDRIRVRVLLCWLVLLVRIIERQTGEQWSHIRRTLQRMHLGEFTGREGAVLQHTETTPDKHHLFTALRILEPPRIFAIAPTHTGTRTLSLRARVRQPAEVAISSGFPLMLCPPTVELRSKQG